MQYVARTNELEKSAPKPKTTVEASPVVRKTRTTGGCERFRPIVERYNWNVQIAMAIMRAESSCNPSAYNGTLNSDGTNDAGLFQINSVHDATSARLDPETNVRLAYKVYVSQGWSAWSVFNNKRYMAFL